MHNYDFGSIGSTPQSPYGGPENGTPRKHSMFSLIVMIMVVAVVAIAGLGIAFWVLGFLFSLVGWILKVAVLAAVAAFVWRRVSRRCSPRDQA